MDKDKLTENKSRTIFIMKTKNSFLTLFALILTAGALTGCSKDDDGKESFLVGNWIYEEDEESGYYYADLITFKNNGSFRWQDVEFVSSYGTPIFNDTDGTYFYNESSQSISFCFDEDEEEIWPILSYSDNNLILRTPGGFNKKFTRTNQTTLRY